MAESCSKETGFEPAGVAAPNDETSLSRLYEAAVARAAAGDLPLTQAARSLLVVIDQRLWWT